MFSTDSKSASKLSFYQSFFTKKVQVILSLFANFEVEFEKRLKKQKNAFQKCVLELNFASISGLEGSILSKNIKIVVPYPSCTLLHVVERFNL
jgi:hypothetical protein